MKIFERLYNRVYDWASHQHAPKYLVALSFAESSFFPIPPDVMLAPMSLAKPLRAYWFAFLTTISSVAGGILGYLLGAIAFHGVVLPFIESAGYQLQFEMVMKWFHEWGFWAVFVAGFTPIPYKLFTIGAGVMQLSLPVFIFASFVGRGLRFFLVSGLVRWFGPKIETLLKRYVDRIGWFVVLLVGFYGVYKLLA